MSIFHFLLAAAWFLLWILTFHTGLGAAGRRLRRRARTEAAASRPGPADGPGQGDGPG